MLSLYGEVNSKNSFGGYAGFSRFCIYNGDALLWEPRGMAEGAEGDALKFFTYTRIS